MNPIKLSLRPLQDARWVTHTPTGAEFLVAPLLSQDDQELSRASANMAGDVDMMVFAQKVAERVLRDWRGMGDAGTAAPCNPENVRLFVQHHGLTIMPWLIREARSIEHYRLQEVEAAKNG